MKILFLNPPLESYRAEYPPLGVGILASCCIKEGHDVDFLDLSAINYVNLNTSWSELLDSYIKNFKPDVCSFSLYTTGVNLAFKLIKQVKKINKEIIIIVGGPHATVMPMKTMEECEDIDFLVYGEGESTLVELLDKLDNKEAWNVRGIFYRVGKVIKINQPRQPIEDLDSLPFPSRDLFEKNLHEYLYDEVIKHKPVASVITGRGCPFNCAFCASKAIWGKRFIRRTPENVVDEIRIIREKHKIKEIYFQDDLFLMDSKWTNRFCRLILKEGLDISFKCLGRPNMIKTEDILSLKKVGCHTIQLGVESGNDIILRNINKKLNTKDVIKGFKKVRKLGLNTYGFFIFGHRGDTYETIRETYDFAKKLNPDFTSFFILVPFPGTLNYNFLPFGLKYEWDKIGYFNIDQPISICQVKPEDLIKMVDETKKYYLRAGYILNNIMSKRPLKMAKLKLVFINTGLYYLSETITLIKRFI